MPPVEFPSDVDACPASSDVEIFLRDVVDGLSSSPKQLPCKYFYDHRGSQLFDEICELPEYYLTRTELSIMRDRAAQMGDFIGPGSTLVEYGSGSSLKTRILLDAMPNLGAYVPVDISHDHLLSTAEKISEDYPDLKILPVSADFTNDFELPDVIDSDSQMAVYFPGSTIGNFLPDRAVQILQGIANLCGSNGRLLIGIDLQKDRDVLEAAYNDEQGVTSEFNLNLIRRIRDELGADIDPEQFEHVAFYNDTLGRVEIFLRSLADQSVLVGDDEFHFGDGELIHTEFSHKYTVDGFAEYAKQAGFELDQTWTDDKRYFAVLGFTHLRAA